jgi:hypothetical protein
MRGSNTSRYALPYGGGPGIGVDLHCLHREPTGILTPGRASRRICLVTQAQVQLDAERPAVWPQPHRWRPATGATRERPGPVARTRLCCRRNIAGRTDRDTFGLPT